MTVVLLHGLARDEQIMSPMATYLRNETAHQVITLSYPTTTYDFPKLVEIVQNELMNQQINASESCHFVGHSMGGIIIRLLLREWRPSQLGRVIQVGSPNQGTPVVDFLNKTGLFKIFYGPAATRLGTDSKSIMHELIDADYPVGIIAADQINWKDQFFDWFVFKEMNDGLVPLESAKIKGMSDFRIVHADHVAVVSHPKTLAYVKQFIEHGSFIAG